LGIYHRQASILKIPKQAVNELGRLNSTLSFGFYELFEVQQITPTQKRSLLFYEVYWVYNVMLKNKSLSLCGLGIT